jgi:hypothetical protein
MRLWGKYIFLELEVAVFRLVCEKFKNMHLAHRGIPSGVYLPLILYV